MDFFKKLVSRGDKENEAEESPTGEIHVISSEPERAPAPPEIPPPPGTKEKEAPSGPGWEGSATRLISEER